MSSGINLVMTVNGFSLSVMFIVFVCTRLICERIHLNAARRSFARASTSDPSTLERGLHGLEPLVVANFPTKKFRELCVCHQKKILSAAYAWDPPPERKWFMQSMFSSSIRSQHSSTMHHYSVNAHYYCRCMENSLSRSHDNQVCRRVEQQTRFDNA